MSNYDTYYVKVDNKTRKNIYYDTGSKKCYYISKNDKQHYREQPILTLSLKKPSLFYVDVPGHPIYFGVDSVGEGYGSLNQPIEQGRMVLPIPGLNYSNLNFYYQCQYHPNMGNKINIKN